MKYEGMIYRPPSEAYSLILQVTIGCSHNKCTFCGSFKDKKFRVRSFEEVRQDVEEAKQYARYVTKVFIADGDALIIPQKMLVPIVELVRDSFPKLEKGTDRRRFPLRKIYELCLKCSHLFNILDARGAISVTERVALVGRIRRMTCGVAAVYVSAREEAIPA